jgi:hypothetical protein
MKYKIVISGRGSETYVHKLNEDQINIIKEMDLEDPDVDELSSILKKEDIFDTDDIIFGAYSSPENFLIIVYDEEDNLIWESSDDHEFEDCDFRCVFDMDKVLLIEDYVKGQFYSYELETDDFDFNKLTPVITEIGERIEVITDLVYDDQSLEKDYLDYWSKGMYYYLND